MSATLLNPLLSYIPKKSPLPQSTKMHPAPPFKNVELLSFKEGPHTGVLLYDRVKKIQAYLKNAQGVFTLTEVVHPFSGLYFKSASQLRTFKNTLAEDCWMRISQVSDPTEDYLKVSIFLKLKGGLTPVEKEQLRRAQAIGEQGMSFYLEGKLEDALTQFFKCLATQRTYDPDSINVAISHNNIGLAFGSQGRLEEALDHHKKSLAIKMRLQPNQLSVANTYNNIGLVYQDMGKLDEALVHFQKSVDIKDYLAPESLDLATTYNNMGSVYLGQGKIEKALQMVHKGLVIREKRAYGTLDLSASYLSLGSIYSAQGKFEEALKEYRKCLIIEERLAPGGLDVALTYKNMGSVYFSQGKLDEALEYYKKSLVITERLNPRSLDVATIYRALGDVYRDQSKFEEALEQYEKSLVIIVALAPGSLYPASVYISTGLLYHHQGKLEEALKEFQKGLAIQELLAPESLDTALSYYDIGSIYYAKEEFQEAFDLFEKAYNILEKQLLPKHPNLLSLGIHLAQAALKLNKYDTAIDYADKTINGDASYKYAYDVKGEALKNLGKFDEALKAFDQALSCDPGYADASLHRLEAITALAERTQNIQSVIVEAVKTQQIQKTDYDATKRRELEEIAKISKQETKIDIPSVQYEAGSKEYLKRIEEILLQLKAKTDSQEARIDHLDVRVSSLGERLDILDGRVLKLEDSLSFLKLAKEDLDQKIAALSPASSALQKLLAEKERLMEKEKQIKAINKNPDLRHYFYALLSEMEAAYIAAQVIGSGKLQENKSSKYTKAASYASNVIELFPVVGQLASSLISGVASLIDTKASIKGKNDFLRIRSLSPTLVDFDQIALHIAMESTLSNKDFLTQLEEEEIPRNWKTTLKSLEGGLEALMNEFLKDNETKAKVLGRLDAYRVIQHLQKEAVCENYAQEEEEKNQEGLSRHSLIGSFIIKNALVQHLAKAPLEALPVSEKKTDEKNSACCTVQ